MEHAHHQKQTQHDHSHHIDIYKGRLWVSLILSIPILLLSEQIQIWFNYTLLIPFQGETLFILSLILYLYGGSPFLTGMVKELRTRQPGMMTLIGTAISIAFIYSSATVFLIAGKDFFWELATLIDVMLFGHWIEAKSVLGASRALEELVKIMPTIAHLERNGKITDVPVSQLKVGDTVLIRPGEKSPSDGIVVEGESYVNEALLTGESKPIHKTRDAKIIGGSINGEGALKVKIEKTGEETYLAQVIQLVREAQESKSRTQDLANRASAYLFYIAISVGIITYLSWFTLGFPNIAIERAVTVMVIACPHALGLAIPLVVALSTSITAKSGILIRDRLAFETMKDVDAVVFDKTGTLTVGQFGVSDVVTYIPRDELLQYTASVEINSEHIIASAIVAYAKEQGIQIPKTKKFQAIPGKGISGTVNHKEVYVGSSNLLKELDIAVEDHTIKRLQEQGKTVVFTVVEKKLAGAFALADAIRSEAQQAIKELKANGVAVYMLTGDAEETAHKVAQELAIDEYFAEVLPAEKAEKIKLLQEKGHKVAMVGDGINDAPALVTADVGVAIGAGTDVAIESADIILVKNDPQDVSKVEFLSRRTYSKMVQNLWWAAGYNIIAIPLATGILYGFNIIITPALGALLMSLSTVLVAINSQTLRKFEPQVAKVKEKKHLTLDPVCGMDITPEQAYSQTEYEDYIIYFDSKHCEEKFHQNPQMYMSNVKSKQMKKPIHDHH